jgi:hypothetical protein
LIAAPDAGAVSGGLPSEATGGFFGEEVFFETPEEFLLLSSLSIPSGNHNPVSRIGSLFCTTIPLSGMSLLKEHPTIELLNVRRNA